MQLECPVSGSFRVRKRATHVERPAAHGEIGVTRHRWGTKSQVGSPYRLWPACGAPQASHIGGPVTFRRTSCRDHGSLQLSRSQSACLGEVSCLVRVESDVAFRRLLHLKLSATSRVSGSSRRRAAKPALATDSREQSPSRIGRRPTHPSSTAAHARTAVARSRVTPSPILQSKRQGAPDPPAFSVDPQAAHTPSSPALTGAPP